MDQRICIKFCVKNEIKCSKTLEMLTVAYGETVLSKKNVYRWYKLFQDGREDANDEPLSGRPSSLFSSITVAWCIRSSYHVVVRSIKSIILKLCAACEKQYEENVRNWGKTIHGFCITIMPRSLIFACERFIGQKQHHNHASATIFT